MSMEPPNDTSTILEPEAEAPTAITGSFWDSVAPFSSSIEKSKENPKVVNAQKAVKSNNIKFIAAVFVLLLSIIFGYRVRPCY
ncbi:hypothetical protein SLEP1_g42030 [Rubroshorea leprosula]|nr:hypothetical protein SLEP1_g42030 [Rubroshorea leprosula]